MKKRGLCFLATSLIMAAAMAFTIGTASVQASAVGTLRDLNEAFVEIAKKVTPAVVAIKSSKTVKGGSSPFEMFPKDHPLRRFFEDEGAPFFKGPQNPHGKGFQQRGMGSGMIVSPDGYILTNYHVVKDADVLEVVLADKRTLKGKVKWKDPDTDVAVVKIEANNLPTVSFGDSDKSRVGEIVLAVGGPFGLTQSVTSGIVSATGRNHIGLTDQEDFIQTDAAINPGNSGGPLVNANGEVIGMNIAIFSRSGGYQGIGFAVPSNTAKYVMDKLRADGKIRRGLLGVMIQDITPALAKSLGLKDTKGAVVAQVTEGSAAEKVGIKPEDVVTQFNGQEIEDSGHLKKLVSKEQPGTKATLTILRDGKIQSKSIVLGERTKDKMASAEETEVDKTSNVLGIEIEKVPASAAEKMGLKENEGVRVSNVAGDGVGATMGLEPGDVILKVDGQPVSDADQFSKAVKQAKENKIVRLTVKRGKQPPILMAQTLE